MGTKIVAGALRLALIGALVVAGWDVYRRLPRGGPIAFGITGQPSQETRLRIVLRRAAGNGNTLASKVLIQLYPIDVAAVQREFVLEQRANLRFEDYLKRFMKDRQPIGTQLDESGQGTALVPPGRWWIHATREGAREDTTWRLPISVSGRELTIELTPENAYTRTKSF